MSENTRALDYSRIALALRLIEQLIHSRANNFILYCPVLPGPDYPAWSQSRALRVASTPCATSPADPTPSIWPLDSPSKPAARPKKHLLRGGADPAQPKVATATGARVFPRCSYHLRPSSEHQRQGYTGWPIRLRWMGQPGVPIPKWAPDQTWTARASGHNRGRPADRSPVSGPLYGRPAPTCAP